jgi:DNA (cytosine-5)-methyltransferase 1
VKVLDLFSGIGGFSLGLERAGMTTIAFCELDPFCRAVLRKHWPTVPIHEDITKLEGAPYAGSIDVICGGFPCQPFSQAGQRRGASDDRHLWPHMFRCVGDILPAWVIGENVIGLESMGLDDCCADLESLGYDVQTFDIPACGVGANHRRHRLWIVAHAQGERLEGGLESERKHEPRNVRLLPPGCGQHAG